MTDMSWPVRWEISALCATLQLAAQVPWNFCAQPRKGMLLSFGCQNKEPREALLDSSSVHRQHTGSRPEILMTPACFSHQFEYQLLQSVCPTCLGICALSLQTVCYSLGHSHFIFLPLSTSQCLIQWKLSTQGC